MRCGQDMAAEMMVQEYKVMIAPGMRKQTAIAFQAVAGSANMLLRLQVALRS